MAKLLDLIKKLGNKEEEEYVPKQVIDKPLDSLRRHRQKQLNELEREQLKKQILEYNKARERKYLWGLKDKIHEEKKKQLLGTLKKKKVNILASKKKILDKKSLLNNEKDEFEETNILKDNSSFMGKGIF